MLIFSIFYPRKWSFFVTDRQTNRQNLPIIYRSHSRSPSAKSMQRRVLSRLSVDDKWAREGISPPSYLSFLRLTLRLLASVLHTYINTIIMWHYTGWFFTGQGANQSWCSMKSIIWKSLWLTRWRFIILVLNKRGPVKIITLYIVHIILICEPTQKMFWISQDNTSWYLSNKLFLFQMQIKGQFLMSKV